MTLFYYGSSGDLNTNRIRLGDGFSLTEAAESGTYAMSRVRVDDPAGNINIVGHHAFRAIETACSWPSLFRGYFADRTIKRADSMRTGAARIWDATVYDLNAALQFEVIRGAGAKRPEETDTERLAWLLGSGFLGPIDSDDSAVFGEGVTLDKQDYRGMTAGDVLSDCAQVSGCNYFVAYDETVGGPVIHYYQPTRAFNSSSIRVSNVLSDIDGSTVFAPDMAAELNRDPSLVYSGVYYQYGEDATAAAYETNATVLAAIGHKRETSEIDPSVNTAARASAKADKWLEEAEDEEDTIALTLHRVPPSVVNLIRAGQRIEVKFTHLPGFESFTWMRIVRRTVQQDGDTQEFYALTLALNTPKQGGSKVRHPPRPIDGDDAEPSTDSSVALGIYNVVDRRSCHNSLVGDDWYPLFTAGSPFVGSWVDENTPYTTAGCPLGGGLWGPGGVTWEAWYDVDVSDAAGDAGVYIEVGTLAPFDGVGSSKYYQVGWAYAEPTDLRQYVVVGRIAATGGRVYVPGALVVDDTLQYVVLAPDWNATEDWSICGNYITSSFGGPLVGGEANSGRGVAPIIGEVTLVPIGLAGTGKAPWVAPVGAGEADGTNTVWTLTGWDGTGVPEARWGAVILSAATDYTYDQDALTVTFHEAPPEGTVVAFRYRVGSLP